MENIEAWSQDDSDIIAHFLQVYRQISTSKWQKSEITYTLQGDVLTDCAFPSFEDFVFVAVYFRQLYSKVDRLLEDAVERYKKFVACDLRRVWIDAEYQGFKITLDHPAFQLSDYTIRELFEAYLYGSSLIHKKPVDPKTRLNFNKLHDTLPREKVLYVLNMSLKTLLNYIGGIAVVVYRDFAHWMDKHPLPRPDVRWHNRIFDVQIEKRTKGNVI